MSLVVEDGTMVAGAESFASVAAADAYLAARGVTAWAALGTPAKEQALRKATDYMEQFYRLNWKGWRLDADQALSWPRSNVELDDAPYMTLVEQTEVPDGVVNACIELASRASTETLAGDLTRGKSSVTIGPISTTYDRADPQYKRFRVVDAMVQPYLKNSSTNVRVVAA